MKGGKFTVDQLMKLFNIFSKDQDYRSIFSNIEILDKTRDLYNNTFHVYVLFNKPPTILTENFVHSKVFQKEMKSVRIIASHSATMNRIGFRTRRRGGIKDNVSRVFGVMKDWTNNARNIMTYKLEKIPKTNRQNRAKKGHEAIHDYLENLKEKNIKSIIHSKGSKNRKYMNLLLFCCLQNKSVSAFLKERLSTIGASQGAVYAYLYGDEGKETVVYNPAPFRGVKPDNTFILKTKNDIVSYFVNNNGLPITIKDINVPLWNFVTNHKNDILLNDEEKIGTGLFTKS